MGSRHAHRRVRRAPLVFGVQELRGLEDAVAWLTSEPRADAAGVGITGHSHGRFMTAWAITHRKAFAGGVAGIGVRDWGMDESSAA